MRSLNKLDFYGRKKGKQHRSSANSIQVQGDAESVNIAQPQYPLVDSIALEIRTHLEDAKDEMTVLQRQYEQ